jgi:hypothetical protein
MKNWMMIAGVLVAVLIVVALVLLKPTSPATDTTEQTATQAIAPAVDTSTAEAVEDTSTVAIPKDPEEIKQLTKKVVQEQKEAQQVVANQVVILPIEGTVRTRPDFISDMEWNMLQAVAQTNANPDSELNHLVNLLRFNKMVEQYQSTDIPLSPENKQKLATQLLAELPNYLKSGDIDQRDARELKDQLTRDAKPQTP